MSMLSIFQNIRTLRIKFLAIVLPSIVFCFIVFSIVFAFLTYRDMEIQLDIEARKIADLQSKALALPLWNYLDENVKQTLDNLLMNPDIIKAVVRDTKGQVIAQAGKADDKGIYKGEVQIEREITFQFVSTGAKRTIGYLAITFHHGRIYEILYKQFIRDSFLLLLLVIAIVGSALAANKLAIEIPLNRLLRAIRKADEEDVREIVHWPARDELGQVIKAYNSLIESLKVAEKALKEHSEHLEELVEERTKELKDAQEQLIRKEKLSVLGKLAGGLGHELRNPLGVISNAVYYLKMVLPDADDNIKEYLEMISSEVGLSTKIVSDLLDFSRIKSIDKEETAITDLVAQVFEKQPAPENIEIITTIPSDLHPVSVDSPQIVQVFGNLVTNAYQAMPKGGKLKIEAKAEEAKVHISITDTGSGISQENLEKLFEPLFTTKARGIGLGLAISKSLVEANGGSIEVESEEGKGSTFAVILTTKKVTT